MVNQTSRSATGLFLFLYPGYLPKWSKIRNGSLDLWTPLERHWNRGGKEHRRENWGGLGRKRSTPKVTAHDSSTCGEGPNMKVNMIKMDDGIGINGSNIWTECPWLTEAVEKLEKRHNVERQRIRYELMNMRFLLRTERYVKVEPWWESIPPSTATIRTYLARTSPVKA